MARWKIEPARQVKQIQDKTPSEVSIKYLLRHVLCAAAAAIADDDDDNDEETVAETFV